MFAKTSSVAGLIADVKNTEILLRVEREVQPVSLI